MVQDGNGLNYAVAGRNKQIIFKRILYRCVEVWVQHKVSEFEFGEGACCINFSFNTWTQNIQLIDLELESVVPVELNDGCVANWGRGETLWIGCIEFRVEGTQHHTWWNYIHWHLHENTLGADSWGLTMGVGVWQTTNPTPTHKITI